VPLEHCQIEGRPGWRWGNAGHCYGYQPGSEESEKLARAAAMRQAYAAEGERFQADLEAFTWYRDLPRNRRRADCSALRVDGVDVRATATVRLRDAKGKRLPVQAFPKAIEARYLAMLRRRVKEVNALVMAAVERTLRKVGPDIDERARADTAGADLRALLKVITQIERAVLADIPDAATLAATGESVAAFTARAVTSQIATVIGIDITARASTSLELVEAWAADNVNLITSIDSRFFDEIRETVTSTVLEGKSTKSLISSIEERYAVSKSRAELIARDQIGKLNGQVTAARQQALGIESFTWSTVGDERVRPAHEEIDGNVYTWADGHPTEGFPGQPIQCRCTALPVLPGQ
jgi:SPP1 gp7 family putative phage head morphogenesis protein